MSTAPMPMLSLASGEPLPAVGLGTWKAARGEVGEAVGTALELGYRHLDCASIYGNEAEIGAALKQALGSSGLQRGDLWITSKLWNDCHSPQEVRPALERSLADLGLEQLDLYLIHWPVAQRRGVLMPQTAEDYIPLEDLPLSATWGAMEQLVEAGLVRHIGVSNCSVVKLQGLLPHCRIRPVMNQVERHPWLQQNALLRFCQSEGIHLTAYAPLGSGSSDQPSPLLQDQEVQAIAAQQGCTAAQVLLAWGLATGTSVIPKSIQRPRLAANLAASGLTLTPEQLERLARLDRQHRFVDGSFWELPGGPYSRQSLWDEPAEATPPGQPAA